MADFDLTQTDQQVQNILNDGQSAMGAGAQTTLTTEYVMLKDTNGIYHKILKSSFTEAIRDVLAGLLVNNDKGTTISQIAAIASGDFGSVTPANLASVLGAVVYERATSSNIDSLRSNGRYLHSVAIINGGTAGGYGILDVICAEGLYVVQIDFDIPNHAVYIRECYKNGSEWNAWSSWKSFTVTDI